MEESRTVPRLFCPGPMYVPERIREAMSGPVLHHRSPEFKEILKQTRQRLRRVWQAEVWEPIVFTASGSGAMEGGVVNFMRRGAKAINVSAGKFSERWVAIIKAYGCEAIELRRPWGRTVSPEELTRLLAQHPDTRAVYLTSAETSTGGEQPIPELAKAIRRASDALIVVDAICDFGGADIRPVEWDVDVVVSCSQKCMMLPPGLGLAIISPRAWSFYESSDLPRFYFDWKKELQKEIDEGVTNFTTAVTLVRGLLESLTMIEEEGLASVVARYRRTADAARAGVAALGLELFPEQPSCALTAVRCRPEMDATKIVEHMQRAHHYRIANGQDELKGKIFRLGHMGRIGEGDILGLLHAVEATLRELGYTSAPPGAAPTAAARVFAQTSASQVC